MGVYWGAMKGGPYCHQWQVSSCASPCIINIFIQAFVIQKIQLQSVIVNSPLISHWC